MKLRHPICLLLAVLLLLSPLTLVHGYAANYVFGTYISTPADAGETAGEISWTINGSILTIRGSGTMHASGRYPWSNQASRITTLMVEEGITAIYGLDGCTALAEVYLPESLKAIGPSCFHSCLSLQEIVFPPELEKIGPYAFQGCSSLSVADFTRCEKEITFGTDENGNSGLFDGCTALTGLVLPTNLTALPPAVFHNCSALLAAWIPETCKSVSDVFSGSGISRIYYGGKEADWAAPNLPTGVTTYFESAPADLERFLVSDPAALLPLRINALVSTPAGMEIHWVYGSSRNPSAAQGDGITAFRIQRQEANGSFSTVYQQAPEAGFTWLDEDVSSGMSYIYKVEAVREDEDTVSSQPRAVTYAPDAATRIVSVQFPQPYRFDGLLDPTQTTELTVLLSDALSPAQLKGTQFLGTASLLDGNDTLGSWSNLQYKASDNTLSLVLNPTDLDNGVLQPNHTYTLLLTGANGEPFGSMLLQTGFQTWPFGDPKLAPSAAAFAARYGDQKGALLAEKTASDTKTLGFGMAYSLSLVNRGYLQLNLPLLEQADRTTELDSGGTVQSLLEELQSLSYSPNVQNTFLENQDDFVGLIAAVSAYTSGSAPMPVLRLTDGTAAHYYTAVGWSPAGGILSLYDPDTPDSAAQLIVSRYQDPSSCTWTCGNYTHASAGDDVHMSWMVPSGNPLQNTAATGTILVSLDLPISNYWEALLGGTSFTKTDTGYTNLWWISGSGILDLSRPKGEIKVADDHALYTISDGSAPRLDVLSGTVGAITTPSTTPLRLACRFTSISGPVMAEFNGTGDGTLSLRRAADTVTIDGATHGTLGVSYESGNSWTHNLVGPSLMLQADGQNPPTFTDDVPPLESLPVPPSEKPAPEETVQPTAEPTTAPSTAPTQPPATPRPTQPADNPEPTERPATQIGPITLPDPMVFLLTSVSILVVCLIIRQIFRTIRKNRKARKEQQEKEAAEEAAKEAEKEVPAGKK